ncbi:putative domain XH, Zinc finger-XS domain protein [Artemisia annua]|uniref:Putative domain XH, Zinc finger-XS domain protein n=1 Tax=Artemisia annua TaxID=35608 RepID=A0A2U1NWR6_ARTAN|nr:putative domain XH, Zinc finger-XS domain protein [Artemisia annua]
MSQQGKETWITDSELEDYKDKYYRELWDGRFKVWHSEKILVCPYSPGSRESETTVRVTSSGTQIELRQNQKALSGKKLKDEWIKQGYNPVKVHPLWSWRGHSGVVVVEFGKKWDGFSYAMMFVKAFQVDRHWREDYYDRHTSKDDKLYAWLARDKDYNSNSLFGDYLRKNGDLKTLVAMLKENEEERDLKTLVAMLKEDENDRVNLQSFFKDVARRDGAIASRATLRLSKQPNCHSPQAFYKGTPKGRGVHPADCMHQLLEQVRRHQVNVDGNVFTLMVTTSVLEGWQRKLDPDYDIMRTLQKLVLKDRRLGKITNLHN